MMACEFERKCDLVFLFSLFLSGLSGFHDLLFVGTGTSTTTVPLL